MKYLLDTNICIFIITHKPMTVWRRMQFVSPGDIAISSITVSELLYGVAKSVQVERNQAALEKFLMPLEILSYNEDAARHYGLVRAHLESKGKPVGPMDLLIAAHALSLNLTVVTNNVREFKRIPGLSLENWTQK